MDTLSRDWTALSSSLHVNGVRLSDHGDSISIESRSISWPRLALALALTIVPIAVVAAFAAASLGPPWMWGGLASAALVGGAGAARLSRSGVRLVAEPLALTWSERGRLGGRRHRIAYRDIRAIEVCDAAGTTLARQHGLRSIGAYHVAVWHGPFLLRTLAADNPDSAERIQQAVIAAIGEMRSRGRSASASTPQPAG